MSTPTIRLRGARTHNLRALDVDIPRDRLVVVTGLSGSGKSSLVFDTIAAEAGFQLNETYPPFTRNRLPRWSRPEVDEIHGISPVIVIDQKRLGGSARSTVGTASEAWNALRLLFSRLSTPQVGDSGRFSFNLPGGMCPTCSGLGEVVTSAVDRFLDLDRSLAGGAIRLPGFGNGGYWYRQYADIGSFDPDTPLREWSEDERRALLHGGEAAARLGVRPSADYEGVVDRFERIFLHTSDELSERKAAAIREFTRSSPCPECEGDRLAAPARTARLAGLTIGEMSRLEITELARVIAGIHEPAVAPVRDALVRRLRAMCDIGLGYLQLARATTSLSGGESQRLKTVKHLGSSLVQMLYVIDEPTIGLHPHDISTMNALLEELRDKGNTVLVVEHKPETIAIADHVVDLGPRAGADGGTIGYQGDLEGLRRSDTLTGQHLDRRTSLRESVRRPSGHLEIRGADQHNLRSVDVDIPLGVLTVVTGVAGSGKSSLVHSSMPKDAGAIVVDQAPIRGSRRSNPATYTGLLEPIRKAFAKANGVKPALFSNNSEGACPACKGAGMIYTELGFMVTVATPCEECEGRRVRTDVLEHRFGGKDIAEVLDLSVARARELFSAAETKEPAAAKLLGHLGGVGLGHLTIGQPLTTLSGGERQRLKLATHMGDKGGIYVLDEPTTGLHLADVDQLLALLDRLVDAGKTVVVIEHHQAVMAHADHLIDLGPGAGADGGRIVFEGSPAELVADATTLTGQHLKQYLGA